MFPAKRTIGYLCLEWYPGIFVTFFLTGGMLGVLLGLIGV